MAGNFKIDPDYIDVAERIGAFADKHPEGSLQSEYCIETLGDKTFVVCTAFAYRTPDDPRPGHGLAWVPFPGPTPFTFNSELMNAQTSAWGRAIVALGFKTKKIASRQEMQMGSAAADGAGDTADTGRGGGGDQKPAAPATNGKYISTGEKSQQQVLWITADENKVSKERVREIVLEICGAEAAEHTKFILRKDYQAVLDAIKMDGVPFG